MTDGRLCTIACVACACLLVTVGCGSGTSTSTSASATTATTTATASATQTTGSGTATEPGTILGTEIHSLPDLDVGFFDLLARQAGVGHFAQAYVVGHEFGHHVQHLLGIDRRVAAANSADPAGQNARSVRVELQADCLAGVWAHSVYTRGELPRHDLDDALRTAALIGEDFQARAAGRVVDPGLFTHGSSAQRQHWLTTGFESGRPGACDTFG